MSKGGTWVYDPETKSMVPKQEFHYRNSGVVFLPDLQDFTSPIDGKRYSGRAGLREHCAKHDVIPNADLKGLPYLQTNSDFRTPDQKRASMEHRKQAVINAVNRYYR